jgi:exodeoxyribonuclease V alpha subunit
LLGFNPSTGQCRAHATQKLRSDVVIVDECSMIDTLLWQALLAALEPNTRLVLVGDPHQLESVAAGDVLGSLVRFARAHPGTALDRVWLELTESRRFRHRSGIGALAAAIVNGHADDAVHLLASHLAPSDQTPPADGLAWLGDHGGRFAWEHLPVTVRAALTAVADAPTPAEALTALAGVRLLTAHREHTLGAAGLNDAIQRHLTQRPGLKRPPNQPVIINHNDPETRLTNGSVGIIMDVAGTRAAYFPPASADAPPRRVPLGQLPDTSAAWALTIHRSQGSEFDQVLVILPPDDSPLATRELIYTAITRARQCVYVWGGETTVRAALGEQAVRCTLLEASLAALTPAPAPAP